MLTFKVIVTVVFLLSVQISCRFNNYLSIDHTVLLVNQWSPEWTSSSSIWSATNCQVHRNEVAILEFKGLKLANLIQAWIFCLSTCTLGRNQVLQTALFHLLYVAISWHVPIEVLEGHDLVFVVFSICKIGVCSVARADFIYRVRALWLVVVAPGEVIGHMLHLVFLLGKWPLQIKNFFLCCRLFFV